MQLFLLLRGSTILLNELYRSNKETIIRKIKIFRDKRFDRKKSRSESGSKFSCQLIMQKAEKINLSGINYRSFKFKYL